MGSLWVQKMGQNHKKLPCAKIRIFNYPAVIDFLQKLEAAIMAPNHGGDPLGSILGPMGSHWVQKNGSKPQKITMPQNSNFRLPREHRFFAKNGIYGYGAKSRWGSRGLYLGANGVQLGKKNGSKPYKITMPQNSNFRLIFDYPAIIDFSKKMEVTVVEPNHGGDSLGSIMGPMGPIG